MAIRQIIGLVFAAAALVLVVKFVRPYPLPEAQTVLPPQSPAIPRQADEDLLLRMRRNNIWDPEREELVEATSEDAPDAVEAATEAELAAAQVSSEWRLVAVSLAGDASQAVVKSEQGTSVYQVGDELPDGARVTGIGSTGITVERSGIEESVYLFGKN